MIPNNFGSSDFVTWVGVTTVKGLTAASQRQSLVDKLKRLPPSKKEEKPPKNMARPRFEVRSSVGSQPQTRRLAEGDFVSIQNRLIIEKETSYH